MNDDLSKALERDKQRLLDAQQQGFDTSAPALIELFLTTVTAISALAWVISMFLWVPDPVSGRIWLAIGLFGLSILGAITWAVVQIRRGGIQVVLSAIREVG